MIYKTQNVENPNLKSSYTCTKAEHPSGQQYKVTITNTSALFGYWSTESLPTFQDYLDHVYGQKIIKVCHAQILSEIPQGAFLEKVGAAIALQLSN